MGLEGNHNSYTMSTNRICATVQRAFQVALFAITIALHLLYSVILNAPGCGPRPTVHSYITSGDIFLGFSLAVGVLFTFSCLRRFFHNRSHAEAVGTIGGTAAVAGVAAAGCFLTGCCGSPMLIVYASFLGIQGFEVPKWAIAAVTVISTSLGWWWLTRAGKCGCKTKTC